MFSLHSRSIASLPDKEGRKDVAVKSKAENERSLFKLRMFAHRPVVGRNAIVLFPVLVVVIQ
jgi:hypothetical protein